MHAGRSLSDLIMTAELSNIAKDSPSNRYCLIGPIECNEKLIEVFKKGIMVKLKYVEKRVLDTFTDNGVDLSNYTHCIIVKRNFYLAW